METWLRSYDLPSKGLNKVLVFYDKDTFVVIIKSLSVKMKMTAIFFKMRHTIGHTEDSHSCTKKLGLKSFDPFRICSPSQEFFFHNNNIICIIRTRFLSDENLLWAWDSECVLLPVVKLNKTV